MAEDKHGREASGWIGFTSDSIDSLPPEQREMAHKALEEYRARQPLAEVHVRMFRAEKGGCEVQFKADVPDRWTRPDWFEKVADVVALDVADAARILGADTVACRKDDEEPA